MTEAVSVELKCGRCGRAAGGDVFKCPRLAQGDCAFERTRLTTVRVRLEGAGLALLLAFCLVIWIKQQKPDLATGGLIGVFLVVGLWILLNSETQLHDPDSGLTVVRQKLFGFPLSETVRTRGELLPLELDPGRPLPVPASVSQLQKFNHFTMSQAIDVVRAALVSLLVEGRVQVRLAQEYRSRFGTELAKARDVYILSATEKADTARPEGDLETMVLDVLKTWQRRPEGAKWPQGPCLYEVVRGIYDKDVDSPEEWVISIVTGEATMRGLGQEQGWPWRDFVLDEAYHYQLRAARVQVLAWGTQLSDEQPAFYDALGTETKKAIKSRRDID